MDQLCLNIKTGGSMKKKCTFVKMSSANRHIKRTAKPKKTKKIIEDRKKRAAEWKKWWS
jgi:biotin synthase-like enzyme